MNFNVIEGGICAAKGFQAAGIHCGLRKSKKKPDLALIYCEKSCGASAVYTQNKVKGAPIFITQNHLKNGSAQAIIINSGNANTCNPDGEEKAFEMCKLAAQQLSLQPQDIIVASTGIIGEVLPMEPIANHIVALKNQLSTEGNQDAAQAILTTDLVEKTHSISLEIQGKPCAMGGIAKGSGMIHPNMATMLCFLTTDVNIEQNLLDKALKKVVDETFNMISVDGDTSTNDMVTLMSSGLAENEIITGETSPEYAIFEAALFEIMKVLCKKIAQDGEGASKLLEVQVKNADELTQARAVAKSVITSSLFKCAMFGQDPNWGRILCAVGYAEGDFQIDQLSVTLQSEIGSILVCDQGRGVQFDGEKASEILSATEIFILIDLKTGNEHATAWGCDFTYDYVKINADYHT